jgi:hypothetical protein
MAEPLFFLIADLKTSFIRVQWILNGGFAAFSNADTENFSLVMNFDRIKKYRDFDGTTINR